MRADELVGPGSDNPRRGLIMNRRIDYRVQGMCCAEEVGILRREVGGKPGVIDLEFDVLNARMTVEFDSELLSVEQIVQAVDKSGMQAIPWERRRPEQQGSFWERHGRLVLTAASGIFLLAAFVTHWAL